MIKWKGEEYSTAFIVVMILCAISFVLSVYHVEWIAKTMYRGVPWKDAIIYAWMFVLSSPLIYGWVAFIIREEEAEVGDVFCLPVIVFCCMFPFTAAFIIVIVIAGVWKLLNIDNLFKVKLRGNKRRS